MVARRLARCIGRVRAVGRGFRESGIVRAERAVDLVRRCVQEAGAFVVCWTAATLWWTGALPGSALVCYALVSAVASGINAARTLAAHRYDNDHDELSMNKQLLDSCTISPSMLPAQLGGLVVNAFRTLVAPVGLRYHALHHWIPSLPYHNLGRAHRLLVTALTPDAPYGRTIEPGFAPVLRDLLQRSTSRTIKS